MELPPLPTDLYDRLRDDICLGGIQVPILVDLATGDGRSDASSPDKSDGELVNQGNPQV